MSRSPRALRDVPIGPISLDRLTEFLDADRVALLRLTAVHARELLAGRTVWNVNSTATGGGVAEMLQSLVGYGLGAGLDTRWLVVQGDEDFFAVTKRVHNFLHDAPGDGGPLGVAEHRMYDALLGDHVGDLLSRVRRGDIAVLHDPQTAGLVGVLRDVGVHVVWRCHIGSDTVTERTSQGWAFLRPYVEHADAFIFSRAAYVPEWVPEGRRHVIAPSIDPLSVKNQALAPGAVSDVLGLVGLLADGTAAAPSYSGRDGLPRTLRRHSDLIVGGATAPAGDAAPLVVQVSRWDALKDMDGVMTAFVDVVAPEHPTAHLVLAGPAAAGVSDDPEGAGVLEECSRRWRLLPEPLRRRVHLARVPMEDHDENAVIINALQRRASVVVQKSLAEGFGLTVTEAMWKARPVVAGAVGGIPDQITDGVHGLLVDPHDLGACGRAISVLLHDAELAARLGAAAQDRANVEYIGDRQMRQVIDCFQHVLA